jgi:hypothetical protein
MYSSGKETFLMIAIAAVRGIAKRLMINSCYIERHPGIWIRAVWVRFTWRVRAEDPSSSSPSAAQIAQMFYGWQPDI